MTRQVFEGHINDIKDHKIQSMMVEILWSYKKCNNNSDFGAEVITILQRFDFVDK